MPDQSDMSPFPQQPVAVDVDEVATALVTSDPELSYYLHRETGAVALVSAETRADLEEIYTELGGDADLPEASVAAAIRQRAVPDWRHEALLEADQVERGLGTRYVVVPREQPQEAHRAMEEFIGTVDDALCWPLGSSAPLRTRPLSLGHALMNDRGGCHARHALPAYA